MSRIETYPGIQVTVRFDTGPVRLERSWDQQAIAATSVSLTLDEEGRTLSSEAAGFHYNQDGQVGKRPARMVAFDLEDVPHPERGQIRSAALVAARELYAGLVHEFTTVKDVY